MIQQNKTKKAISILMESWIVLIIHFDLQTFCRTFALTGIHFQGQLQHVGHVGQQKITCRPIRTRKFMISNYNFD